MRTRQRILRPRSGIALVLVIAAMAIATVMAYAMLSGGAMQEQVAVNSIAQANADALAESGVSLAMYYLIHPSTAPVAATPPYTLSGITFNSANGSVTLTVGSYTQVVTGTNTIGYAYPVTSTATTSGITREVTATVLVKRTFESPQAISSNGTLTLNSSTKVTSSGTAIVANGGIAYGGGTVNGSTYSTSTPSGSNLGSATTYISSTISNPSPSFSQVRSYATYTYNGQTCTAQTFAGNNTISAAPTANSTNPAGIFIYNGNLTTTGTISMTGTLIVNGSLILGTTTTATVNLSVTAPADSQGHTFPAVLVSNQFQSDSNNKKAAFTGLCLFQNGLSNSGATGTSSTLTITGGLLLPGVFNSVASPYKGTPTINYNSTYANVPDLTTSVTSPSGVKMTSWSD